MSTGNPSRGGISSPNYSRTISRTPAMLLMHRVSAKTYITSLWSLAHNSAEALRLKDHQL